MGGSDKRTRHMLALSQTGHIPVCRHVEGQEMTVCQPDPEVKLDSSVICPFQTLLVSISTFSPLALRLRQKPVDNQLLKSIFGFAR